MGTDFVARLHESAHWEAYVAAAFTRQGFFVRLSPSVAGPGYNRNIDLHVALDDQGPWEPVEVKGTRPLVDENDLVLVCAEKPFLAHVPGWNTDNPPVPYNTYAWWCYVNPGTGVITMLPKGTPVTMGHMQWDRKRNDIYPVVKAPANALVGYEEGASRIRKAIGGTPHGGYVLGPDPSRGDGGVQKDSRSRGRPRAAKRKVPAKHKPGAGEMGGPGEGDLQWIYTSLPRDFVALWERTFGTPDNQARV